MRLQNVLLAFGVLVSSAFAADKNFEDLWERSIVTVEVTRKQIRLSPALECADGTGAENGDDH